MMKLPTRNNHQFTSNEVDTSIVKLVFNHPKDKNKSQFSLEPVESSFFSQLTKLILNNY